MILDVLVFFFRLEEQGLVVGRRNGRNCWKWVWSLRLGYRITRRSRLESERSENWRGEKKRRRSRWRCPRCWSGSVFSRWEFGWGFSCFATVGVQFFGCIGGDIGVGEGLRSFSRGPSGWRCFPSWRLATLCWWNYHLASFWFSEFPSHSFSRDCTFWPSFSYCPFLSNDLLFSSMLSRSAAISLVLIPRSPNPNSLLLLLWPNHSEFVAGRFKLTFFPSSLCPYSFF